ncbi:unnamed protein product, partial [marine sediment metagenome]
KEFFSQVWGSGERAENFLFLKVLVEDIKKIKNRQKTGYNNPYAV